MADGFSPTRAPIIRHEPGVYLDLPMADYLRDDALSGSGLKKRPEDWRWELPDNPLYRAPESDARALGTMVHSAVLEGLAAYEARYFVAPAIDDMPCVMRTADDMKAWCKDHDLKVSGVKAELIERIRGHWAVMSIAGAPSEDEPIFWEEYLEREARGRELIKADADRYVRLVEHFVRSDAQYHPLLSDGVAELSIFWVQNGVRFKARLDLLNLVGVLDLKKFGQPQMMGRSLLQHVLREAAMYSYEIQAVHNVHAVEAAGEMLAADNLNIVASGADASRRIDLCVSILRHYAALQSQGGRPTFHWLFVRTPGPPVAIAPAFTPTDQYGNINLVWAAAEEKIAHAIERHREFRERFGEDIWLRSDGVVRADITDWPMWTTEAATE